MLISQFSGIVNKLKFLDSFNRTDEEANTQLCVIECFKTEKKIKGAVKEVNVVRFSIDAVYTEVFPYDKNNGDMLKETIAVNLFDLYNIVANCKDDIISFEIVDGNLVIDTFFNEQLGMSELQALIPLQTVPDMVSKEFGKKVGTLKLTGVAGYTIMRHLDPEYKADKVYIKSDGDHITFASSYNGLITKLEYMRGEDYDVKGTFEFSLPFKLFNMMTSTGEIGLVQIKIHENFVVLDTEDYKFAYKMNNDELVLPNHEYNEFTVIHKETAQSVISLLQQIDLPRYEKSVFTMQKLKEKLMNLSITNNGRYTVNAILACATLHKNDDASLSMDTNLINNILQRTPVDALAVKVDDSMNHVYIESCDLFVNKVIYYNVGEFAEFRARDSK